MNALLFVGLAREKMLHGRSGQKVLAPANCRQGYDLTLRDEQIPVRDGLAATQRIRDWEQDHERLRAPIGAVTVGAFESSHRRCIESGMDDCLTNPISMEALSQVPEKWLR